MSNDKTIPRVLIVDDDPFFRELMTEVFSEWSVDCHQDGQSLQQASSLDYELVMLDIDIGEETVDGYSLCQKIRNICDNTPVLFVSSMADLDSRLKAYGAGGNDYIAKPFNQDELLYKAQSLVRLYRLTQTSAENPQINPASMLDVQREAANLQVVNRFILSAYQCKSFDSLFSIFLHTLRGLNTEGVLHILDRGIKASNAEVSLLEMEILEMADALPRIHSFGHQRAVFNWGHCQLLVRNIGGLIDTLAILMDALESAVAMIENAQKISRQITSIEDCSRNNRQVITNLLEQMGESINDEILTLGLVSSLEPDEEKQLKQVVEQFNTKIGAQLREQEEYNHKLNDTLTEMSTPTEAFAQYLASIECADNEQTDSVELF